VHQGHGAQPLRQLERHILLAPPQERGSKPRTHCAEILIEDDALAHVVMHDMVAIDLPEWRQEPLVDELS
jgi:hypothetical protein